MNQQATTAMGQKLLETIEKIRPADEDIMKQARQREESLAKPPGSLGGLEDMAVRIAGMTGSVKNSIETSCVAVFCADNGVTEEGVASAPTTVTAAQTMNFTRRLTGVGALAKAFGSDLLIVDVGVKDPIPRELYDYTPLQDTHKIVYRKVRFGTSNIAKGPAMSKAEAIRCIETGIEMADAIKDKGFDIMGVGEMGIGNTTTSAALLSAITGEDSSQTVGRGGGVNDEGFARKRQIVDQVSAKYRASGGILSETGWATGDFNGDAALRTEAANRMITALAELGGFDICAMAGAFLGAAKNRMPVVIDGYISVVAALAAYVIAPACADYMIASHKSYEDGYSTAVKALGLAPFLSLDMRLGEGSGCPIAFQVVKGACSVMRDMATFDEAAINDDYLEEIRNTESFQR